MANFISERKDSLFRLTRISARFLLCPLFRIQVNGLENLPEKQTFIVLPKHQRWEDIPLLGLAIPRPLYYIAKYELFENPLSGWFLSSLGGIPLNRESPLRSRRFLKIMLGLLRGGEGVVIFPEGTYYREKIGAGHAGLIRMILSRFKVPFIPMGIRYSEKGIRKSVIMNIGHPLYGDSSVQAAGLLESIMREIARLSGM